MPHQSQISMALEKRIEAPLFSKPADYQCYITSDVFLFYDKVFSKKIGYAYFEFYQNAEKNYAFALKRGIIERYLNLCKFNKEN